MQLVNVKTGAPEDIPEGELGPTLAAGTHVAPGAKALIDPDGKLVFSPLSDVPNDLQNGYAVPTQAQLNELSNQQKYGEGAGNVAKAALEGAARGATFGLSDVAERGLGISTPEAMRERRARNPVAATTGEIGGAIGSALLAPELSPAGLLGKVGTGVAEGLAPAALGEGASLAAKALNYAGQVGARAAGSAIEGAAYGAGQSVTEAALGDPNLTAEKVMANIGYGGFFGGALGGLLKAGEIAVPAAFEKAKDALSGARDALVGAPGEEAGPLAKGFAAASGAITGEDPEAIVSAIKNRAEILDPAQKSQLVKDLRTSVQDVHDAITNIAGEAGGKARPEETAALLKDSDLNRVFQGATEADQSFSNAIEQMKAEPDLYPKAYRRELELIHEGFQNRVTGEGVGAADTFEALNTAKKLVDEQIPYDKIRQRIPLSPEEKRVVSLLKPLADGLRSGLEDESRWGVAGARQAAFNDAATELQRATKDVRKLFWNKQLGAFDGKKFNTYVNEIKTDGGELRTDAIKRFFEASHKMVEQAEKTAESAAVSSYDPSITGLIQKSQDITDTAQSAIMGQPGQGYGFFTSALYGHMLGGPVGTAASIAKSLIDPYVAAGRLGNLERAAQKSSDAITTASKAIFNPATSATYKAIGPVSGELTKEAQEKQYNKRVEQIEEYNTAPIKAIDKLDWVTKDMYHVAPNVSSSLQMTAIRGNQFLSTKIPKPTTPRLPFDGKWAPSRMQMIKFDRYYNIVHRPLSALSELKGGTVHPETVETLQTVYPQLYTEMKTELYNSMSNAIAKKVDIPYQRRMAISMFLGQAIDSSMQSMMSNQMVLAQHAAAKAAEQSPIKSTSKGVGNITLSGRLQTNIQNSAQRERA